MRLFAFDGVQLLLHFFHRQVFAVVHEVVDLGDSNEIVADFRDFAGARNDMMFGFKGKKNRCGCQHAFRLGGAWMRKTNTFHRLFGADHIPSALEQELSASHDDFG